MIGLMVGAVLGRLVPVQAKGKHTGVDYFYDIWEDRDVEQFHDIVSSKYYRAVLVSAYQPTHIVMPPGSRVLSIAEGRALREHRERSSEPWHPSPSAAANVAED